MRIITKRLTKRTTALHESAHAVVAAHFGYPVTSIRLTRDRKGYVVHGSRPSRGARPGPPWRPCPVETALITMAGMAADYRVRSISRKWLSLEDTKNLYRQHLSRYAVMTVLRPVADDLVARLWPKIKRVARTLEERRWPTRLRRRQCERLLS